MCILPTSIFLLAAKFYSRIVRQFRQPWQPNCVIIISSSNFVSFNQQFTIMLEQLAIILITRDELQQLIAYCVKKAFNEEHKAKKMSSEPKSENVKKEKTAFTTTAACPLSTKFFLGSLIPLQSDDFGSDATQSESRGGI